MSPFDPVHPGDGHPGDGHPVDDVAAHAVDLLEGDERAAVEAHLARCASCRRDLDDHRAALAGLVPDEPAPPGVWDRIVAETVAGATGPPPVPRPPVVPGRRSAPGAPPDNVVPLTADGPPRHMRPVSDDGRGARRRLVVLAGVAAAVVVVVALAPRVWDSLDDDGTTTTEVVAPAGPTGDLVAEDGTVVGRIGADADGSFVELDALPTLTADRTYQLWSLDEATPVSLAVLGTGDDPVVRVDVPEGTVAVAVSEEPAGGSRAPTGPIAGQGELALES